MKEHCVIAAVGKSSLHREWINNGSNFDLHLIVYDDSFGFFKMDTPYIIQAKGYKFRLLDDYIRKNDLLRRYEYFYLPDDDILICSEEIDKLFRYMIEYGLSMAQPAICNYYVSHPHTLRRPNSNLRYTNFIEIMQPCFSKAALKRVRFTFQASISGWGIDYHWSKILEPLGMKMAVIDDVLSAHIRPVQSSHYEELQRYMARYGLNDFIIQ